MDKQKLEFIRLIDRALEISKQEKSPKQAKQFDNLARVLNNIKSQVIAEQLEPSQGISTLGLSRGVADWVDSLDSPVLEAVGAIELYYQQHF